jgi:glycosyltransferase involved in cell wall biosynthesis/nucleotide-binding universal stress UspA family protein
MAKAEYKILLPVTKKTVTERVLRIAASLLADHNGQLIGLGVVDVSHQLSYSHGTLGAYRQRLRLKRLNAFIRDKGLNVSSIVKVSRDSWAEVLSTAGDEACDLLILGWDGSSRQGSFFGRDLDVVARDCPIDLAVIKPGRNRGERNVLLPVVPGVETELTFEIANTVCERLEADLTILLLGEDDFAEATGYLELVSPDIRPRTTIINRPAPDMAKAVIEESAGFDFVVMAAAYADLSCPGIGRVPKAVAARSRSTVIIAKSKRRGRAALIDVGGLEDFGSWREPDAAQLSDMVDKWFAENTFHGREFADLDELVFLKEKQGLTVSLGLPALNEAKTVGAIISCIKESLLERHKLLDEIVLIDSDSSDRTRSIAEELGIPVYIHQEILPQYGSRAGKGEALWKSLHVLKGDIVAWIDTDISNIRPEFVYGIIGPLIKHRQIGYVKGFYDRPIKMRGKMFRAAGGRVTELTARPLLNLFYPALSGLIQPLSGEYAGRRDILEQLAFYSGYGVEIGMLIDILDKFGLEKIGQVDLVERIHRNQSLESLSKMAFAITQVIMEHLEAKHKVRLIQKMHKTMKMIHRQPGRFHLEMQAIGDVLREPMINIPEYRSKFHRQGPRTPSAPAI